MMYVLWVLAACGAVKVAVDVARKLRFEMMFWDVMFTFRTGPYRVKYGHGFDVKVEWVSGWPVYAGVFRLKSAAGVTGWARWETWRQVRDAVREGRKAR